LPVWQLRRVGKIGGIPRPAIVRALLNRSRPQDRRIFAPLARCAALT